METTAAVKTRGRRLARLAAAAACLYAAGLPAAPALAQDLASIPNNTWVRMSPSVVPSGRGLEARSFSGMAWDEQDGVVVNFGGGHGSYLGNDVDLYDPSTGTWTQAYPPEFPQPGGGGSTSTDPYAALVAGTLPLPTSSQAAAPSGRPWSAHTYQAMAVDRNGLLLYVDLRYSTWTYLVRTGVWKRLSPGTAPQKWDSLGHALVYAPDTGAFVLLGTEGSGTWVYAYTGDDTAPWVPVGGIQPGGRIHHAMAADPVTHKVLLFGGETYTNGVPSTLGDTWLFDTVLRRWERRTPSGRIPPPRSGHGLAYDSLNRVFILFGGRSWSGSDWVARNDMYLYRVETNAWEEVAQPAVRPSAGGSDLVFGGFVYSPRHNVFILQHAARGYDRPGGTETFQTVDTWVYRYRSGTLSMDRTAPGPPPRVTVR